MNVLSDFAASEWAKHALKAIEDYDSMREYCDMFWQFSDGTLVPDVRGVYMRFGEPLASTTGNDRTVQVSGFMAVPDLFHMIRVYCHTGHIMYGKTESPRALLKRYECIHFFNIPRCKSILQKLIVDRLDIYSAIHLFDIMALKDYNDNPLMDEIAMYVMMHFGEAGKMALHQVSEFSLPFICDLLVSDKVNISEGKLMNSIYTICTKIQSANPTQLFLSQQGKRSPWQCVRIKGLSIEDIVAFRKSWPLAFQDTFYMCLIEVIQSVSPANEQMISQLGLAETSFAQPRKMRPISCYPRNLPIGSGNFVHTLWADDNLSITYAGVAYNRGSVVDIPPFTCGGSVLQLTAFFQGDHMNITGGLNINISRGDKRCQTRSVTVYLVNFCHGRWNKRSIVAQQGQLFRIDKVITHTALVNEGYRFDPSKYPEYVKGNMILLKVVVATDDVQDQ